jgi:hypothetical protein
MLLVGAGSFVSPAVDDEVQLGVRVADRDAPVGAEVVDAVGLARRRPVGADPLGEGVAPQVQPPEVVVVVAGRVAVVAVGPVVADLRVPLRGGA